GFAGFVDSTATNAQFNSPMGVIRENGNILVGDFSNNCIRNIDGFQKVTTIAGTGVQGFGDGDGSTALFKNPSGIVRNSEGDYFVADTGNHSIRKIVID
ncbi:MAG TPA: hypothetical protein PKD91_11350, partial [Bacteroidia bacterium]|nr:hypothetical protein [Bacteroidia bacterium]